MDPTSLTPKFSPLESALDVVTVAVDYLRTLAEKAADGDQFELMVEDIDDVANQLEHAAGNIAHRAGLPTVSCDD